jgi:hypothetical protein
MGVIESRDLSCWLSHHHDQASFHMSQSLGAADPPSQFDLCALSGQVELAIRSLYPDRTLQYYMDQSPCPDFEVDRRSAATWLNRLLQTLSTEASGIQDKTFPVKAFYCLAPNISASRPVAPRLSFRDGMTFVKDNPIAAHLDLSDGETVNRFFREHFWDRLTQFAAPWFSEETRDDALAIHEGEFSDRPEPSELGANGFILCQHAPLDFKTARSAAFDVLEQLELCNLELQPGGERWSGQTIYRIPAHKLVTIEHQIIAVVTAAAKFFAQEDTVLKMQQPTYVFGDIHGEILNFCGCLFEGFFIHAVHRELQRSQAIRKSFVAARYQLHRWVVSMAG